MSVSQRTLVLAVVAILALVLPARVIAQQSSQEACDADIDQKGTVDGGLYIGTVNLSDYTILVRDFLKTSLSNPRSNINKDTQNLVNLSDYSILARWFLKSVNCPNPGSTPQPTASTTTPPTQTSAEWNQFGHDAGHTNYTTQTVNTPWKYKWQWNGAGPDGKTQSTHLSVPKLVQPITGGGRVYIVAANTVYALEKSTGNVAWSKNSIGTLSATPVYLNGNLFVPSSDGKIYKLNATNGTTIGSFTGTSAFNVALMTANGRLYGVSSNGTLYAINPDTLTKIWEYSGGNTGVTPASYSQNKNTVIYVTQDLYVHAVDATTGLRKWRVKPTTRDYTIADAEKNLTEAENGWPVIAEQHGIVFIRYRLEWNTLWAGPGDKGTFPALNSEGRQYLVSNPKLQALFAMKIDDGSTAFIPNAGNGGAGDGGYLPMGTIPIVRNINGSEVAYVLWRNRLSCEADTWCDSREDTTMGEMVLDSTSVPGYAPGDLRFVMWRDGGNYKDIQTDEMMHINGSGDTLFHNHWLSVQSFTITDRSNTVGATYLNPIKTKSAPNIIWRQVYCAPDNTNCNPQIFPGGTGFSWGPSSCQFNATTRYCPNGLYGYGDQRAYPAGFYEYHNDHSTHTESLPFTIVSDGLVLVKTNDGAILALENGNPLTKQVTETNTIALATQNRNVLGETTPPIIPYAKASEYIGQTVTVEGTIQSALNRLPKAIYLGFTNPHDGNLLLRVFSRDISKFSYDPMSLKGKKIRATGKVSLYWPEGKDPEIIVTDPSQIEIAPFER